MHRVLVIADIHSRFADLERVLDGLDPKDTLILAGDITIHVGDAILGTLVNELQPAAVYCGHVHHPGQELMGKTRVVRALLSVEAPVFVDLVPDKEQHQGRQP